MYNETPEGVRNRILSNIKSPLAKNEGSTLSNLAAGISIDIAELFNSINLAEQLAFIENNFDEFLDKRINEFGMYRKPGEHATGEITIEGTAGTSILNGTRIEYAGLTYVIVHDITLSENTEENVTQVYADEIGLKYNLLEGIEFNLLEPDSRITKVTNKAAFRGGTERETDEEFRNRFIQYQTNKPTSGNVADYIQWATDVDGVVDARVYPLWHGAGTVKVIILGENNGNVDEMILQNCKDYIETKRPIGASVTVVTPMPRTITIVAQISIKDDNLEITKNNFAFEVNEYFKECGKNVSYMKVLGILANMENVTDIKDMTINGAKNNIELTDEQIAVANIDGVAEVI